MRVTMNAGYRHGSMSFHPSIKGPGLLPTPEAPYQFKEFIEGILRDWDFDNICAAHMGISHFLPPLLSSLLIFSVLLALRSSCPPTVY